MSNVDRLKNYRSRLDYAQNFRKNQGYDNLWQRMVNLYRGRQYRGNATGDRLLVNISFSTINTIAPAISIGRPKIMVNPRNPDDGDKAIVTEAIINYWWQHYGCQTEFQRAVKDYLIVGHGWLKTGYRFVEEEKLDNIQDTADEAIAPDEPTSEVESTFIIREDRPFLERVDPFDMYVDPDADNMNDARWIAQRVTRPLVDVKADERYNYTARQSVSATSYRDKTGNIGAVGIGNDSTDTDDAYANIFEYYDINTGEMCVFAESGDKFLIKPTKMPYVFGHPFYMLRNYDIPNFFYPMGELEAIEPLQHELNETRTQMMNHRKRYSRKWLALDSAFDDFGRQMLASDDDNVIVPVKGTENLANVVVPMPALINPPEFYNQTSLILSDIDRVSGVSEYQRGAIPDTTRTAREASIIAEASNMRISEKLVSIENGIAQCASNLIMLAQQYLTGEATVRIAGTEASPVWLTFDKDYISGEFDFTVEAGSTAPRNEAFRRDMALQLVSAIQPFAEAGLVNLPRLAEYVLSIGFGIKDPQSFLQEAPPAPEPPTEGQTPQDMGGLPPDMPPELMQQMMMEEQMGAEQQGSPPQMAPSPDQGGLPPESAGLPPELAGLPPEVLQALLAQMQGQQPV